MPELYAYACGFTTHNSAALLKGAPRDTRHYPAGVFLYEGGGRRILFDTGYAPQPWRTGVAGALYQRLLPPHVDRTIADQLDPSTVTHVVLSHLHPDHIGGVQFFPHATFVTSAPVRAALRSSRLREGVLRGLLPEWFAPDAGLLAEQFEPGPHGLRVADVFGDPGYLLVDLPGHARGHLGALVGGRVLLAGDSSWGRDMLGDEDRIRAVPRFISHDYEALTSTAQALLRAEEAGVQLLFSHDAHPAGVNLL